MSRGTAEDQLAQTALGISAFDQEIGAEGSSLLEERLARRSSAAVHVARGDGEAVERERARELLAGGTRRHTFLNAVHLDLFRALQERHVKHHVARGFHAVVPGESVA